MNHSQTRFTVVCGTAETLTWHAQTTGNVGAIYPKGLIWTSVVIIVRAKLFEQRLRWQLLPISHIACLRKILCARVWIPSWGVETGFFEVVADTIWGWHQFADVQTALLTFCWQFSSYWITNLKVEQAVNKHRLYFLLFFHKHNFIMMLQHNFPLVQ